MPPVATLRSSRQRPRTSSPVQDGRSHTGLNTPTARSTPTSTSPRFRSAMTTFAICSPARHPRFSPAATLARSGQSQPLSGRSGPGSTGLAAAPASTDPARVAPTGGCTPGSRSPRSPRHQLQRPPTTSPTWLVPADGSPWTPPVVGSGTCGGSPTSHWSVSAPNRNAWLSSRRPTPTDHARRPGRLHRESGRDADIKAHQGDDVRLHASGVTYP